MQPVDDQKFTKLEYYNERTRFTLDFINEGITVKPDRHFCSLSRRNTNTNTICAQQCVVRLDAQLYRCLQRYEMDAILRLT